MNQNNESQSEEGKYHGAPLHSIFSFLFVSLFSMTCVFRCSVVPFNFLK